MLTSNAASSGISSRRVTSMGPLQAPTTVYPFCENVAEPSALCTWENIADGSSEAPIVVFERDLGASRLFVLTLIASSFKLQAPFLFANALMEGGFGE